MKISWLWLIPIAVIGYILYMQRGKPKATVAPSAENPGTATKPDSYFKGWDKKSIAAIRNGTASLNDYGKTVGALATGAKALWDTWGGPSGPKSPTTSGSGAGVPTTSDADAWGWLGAFG